MSEADELVERLRQKIVGRRPRDGRGAVKHAGDDLTSLVLEVRYRDAMPGTPHFERYGDLVRLMESGPDDKIEWLGDFILTDLDEILLARD